MTHPERRNSAIRLHAGRVLKCPAGCGRHRGAGMLLCRQCWHLVPDHLQVEVYRTWDALQSDGRREAFDAYLAARGAALDSLPDEPGRVVR